MSPAGAPPRRGGGPARRGRRRRLDRGLAHLWFVRRPTRPARIPRKPGRIRRAHRRTRPRLVRIRVPQHTKPYANVLETIGWTPLIRINKVTRGIRTPVYAKAEFFNPGGSVKDRI